jgi:hypothetical protein
MQIVEKYGIKCNAATGKPMGRPPMDPKKRRAWERCKQEAQVAELNSVAPILTTEDMEPEPEMTDAESLKAIGQRMDILGKVSMGVCEGSIRSVIVSGAGGTGKTFKIEEVTEKYAKEEGVKVEFVTGVLTAINLYMLLYLNKEEGTVVVLDDADGIFFNEDALSILKAAMDTKPTRKISWMSESNALVANAVPKSFIYEGGLIFITNVDFQSIVDRGTGKLAPHLEAMMTRAVYLDLMLHSNRDVGLWIDYLIQKENILVTQKGLTPEQQEKVLEFLAEHRNHFRNLSIRTALKVADYVKLYPGNWRKTAETLELKKK